MAHSEFAIQIMEAGSNNMNAFQTLMGAVNSGTDSISIVQNGVGVVAVITQLAPMLQPVRVVANGLVATTAMAKVVADWTDPSKRVQPGDVLTFISAAGAATVQMLAWAEIGPGVGLTIAGLALAADLQTAAQPYLSSLKIWLGNTITTYLPIEDPISTASSSLYWATLPPNTGRSLATYNEVLSQNGLFVCLGDQGTAGQFVFPLNTPVPGSLTPVNEAAYKQNFCAFENSIAAREYCINQFK
jgi:hypothetical protein